MDKITTMEALRDAYPDLVSQVEAAAKASEKADGIKAERARIQGIEAIEAADWRQGDGPGGQVRRDSPDR